MQRVSGVKGLEVACQLSELQLWCRLACIRDPFIPLLCPEPVDRRFAASNMIQYVMCRCGPLIYFLPFMIFHDSWYIFPTSAIGTYW